MVVGTYQSNQPMLVILARRLDMDRVFHFQSQKFCRLIDQQDGHSLWTGGISVKPGNACVHDKKRHDTASHDIYL